MKRNLLYCVFSFCVCLILSQIASNARAQDDKEAILPAGSLLRCTLDEPNFSSKTAEIGDPVICQLTGVLLFGQSLLPRGSYLGGHLDADKDPGHFFGKGYLRLEFDHIGLPDGEIPVPAKIIAARGYRVNREGDILGNGHAVRDAVEWMFPPLWPIKVLMLPARGPRPTLKREESLTLRLMDDVTIPVVAQSQGRYPGRPSAQYLPNRTYVYPNRYFPARSLVVPTRPSPASVAQPSPADNPAAPASALAERTAAPRNLLVLRNGTTYTATGLRVDGHMLRYALNNGTPYAVPLGTVIMTIVPYQDIANLDVWTPIWSNGRRWAVRLQSASQSGFPQSVTSPKRMTATRTYAPVDLKTTQRFFNLVFDNLTEAQDAYAFFLYQKQRGL